MIVTQTNKKIKQLGSNSGVEYKSDTFLKVFQDEGIVQHFTIKKTPQ